MKRLFVVLIMALMTVQVSCNKEEEDVVQLQGLISTGDGSEPLKNVRLEIIWNKSGISFIKANGSTDELGYYFMTFIKEEDEVNGYYELRVFADTNYIRCLPLWILLPQSGFDFPINNIEKDGLFTRSYCLPYKARVKVNAVGLEKMSVNDHVAVIVRSIIEENADMDTCIRGEVWYSDTSYASYTPVIPVIAEHELLFEKVIFKDNVFYRTYKTLIFPRNETINYTVEFK